MTCRNCGDKSSNRHNPTAVVRSGDVDQISEVVQPASVRTGKSFAPDPSLPEAPPQMSSNPHEAFMQAKALSYEDILKMQEDQHRRASLEIESMYKEMTPAMRRYHVVSLLAVANYENLSMPGVTPDQAIVALKEALDRPDFNEINELYPNLKGQVELRYNDLVKKRILLH